MAIDDGVVALVEIAQQVVVARRLLVARVVETAQDNGFGDHAVKDLHVLDKLGKDPETAFRGLVKQNVWCLGIANGNDADLIGLDLEDPFDRTLEGVLEGHDAIRFQPERLDWLDVERIGHIGGPEFDETEFFPAVFVSLRDGGSPVAGDKADRKALVLG